MRRTSAAGFVVVAAVAASPALAVEDYSDLQERLCTGDAFRLCSSEIPDVDRITACMTRLQNQLSPPCRAVFITPPAAAPAPAVRVKPRKPTQLLPE